MKTLEQILAGLSPESRAVLEAEELMAEDKARQAHRAARRSRKTEG